MVSGYGGTYQATVVDDADPLEQHRLQVVVPEVYGEAPVWAAPSLPPGATGPLPGIAAVVWVSFEHGDSDYPVWESEAADAGFTDAGGGYIGKYRGVVVGNDDPLGLHRVEITVPEVDPAPAWALPAVDDDRVEPPEPGAEVWVEYDNGDPAYPRWVGLA